VYVDDVIIFSQTKEDHVKDIHWVLEKLLYAGMRVSQEKSKFFKKSVEYLGFIVSEAYEPDLKRSRLSRNFPYQKPFSISDPFWV